MTFLHEKQCVEEGRIFFSVFGHEYPSCFPEMALQVKAFSCTE